MRGRGSVYSRRYDTMHYRPRRVDSLRQLEKRLEERLPGKGTTELEKSFRLVIKGCMQTGRDITQGASEIRGLG